MAAEKFRKHVALSERDLALLLGLGEVDEVRVWVEGGGKYVHIEAAVQDLGDRFQGTAAAAAAGTDGWYPLLPEHYVDVSSYPAKAAVIAAQAR